MKNPALSVMVMASLLAIGAAAQEVAKPYENILSRNVFGLASIKIAEEIPIAETPALPRITPTGTTTIFGTVQALFTVTTPAENGQPAKVDNYTLCEGESEAGIRVVEVDPMQRVVVFNNHGTIQELPLAGMASLK